MSGSDEVAAVMLGIGGWVEVARTAGHVIEARFELVNIAARSYKIVETRTRALDAPHYSAMGAKA